MNVEAFRIALASEQQVVVSVWVGVDEKLLGIWSGLDEWAVDMNLVRISPRDGRESVSKGRDVMLDVIHVSEVQGRDLLPEHGVGSDQVGGLAVLVLGAVQVYSGIREEDSRFGLGLILAKHEVADAILGA
jgi:hypothetical protein